MSIILSCPSCNRKLKAKDMQAGRRMKCPACLSIVTVPSINDSSLIYAVSIESPQCAQSVPIPRSTPESSIDNKITGQSIALSKTDIASDELLKRAEAGDTEAMREYGRTCIENATNSDGRDAELLHLGWDWLEKAAKEGNAKAQHDISDGYRAMNELEKAFEWEEKSAKQGLPEAQYNLAVYYQDGIEATTFFMHSI